MKHILKGFITDTPAIAQDKLGVIVIENALDIFSPGGIVERVFIKGTNFVL